MTGLKEQRICIKFSPKLGKTASKTHEILKVASGNNATRETQTSEWFPLFNVGRIRLKLASLQVVCPQVAQKIT
jgi:hypothetical protein